jgi:sec-independent protein translocase protein TatC
MTVGEHLDELRRRLIYALIGLGVAMIATLGFGRWLIELFQWPYLEVMKQLGRPDRLRVLAAQGGFVIYFRVALMGGLVLAAPWVFYQFWRFVAEGLYPRERRWVMIAVPFSAGLFMAGAVFFLFVAAVPLLRFFYEFNDYLGVQTELTLPNHITMMTHLMLVFGVAFQLPVVLGVLGAGRVVTARQLGRYRRHVLVGLFIAAALMTSPSPVDQILLALPMWLLYELGVLVVWLIQRHR